MGHLVVVFGIILVPLGLLALLARTAVRALLCAVLYWLFPTFVLYRDVFGPGLIPYSAVHLMVACAAVSLIPTLLVTVWVSFGRVVPQPQREAEPEPQPRPQSQLVAVSGDAPWTSARGTGSGQGGRPVPAGPPAGWYVVPGGPVGQLRWWDGVAWTGHVWPPR
jgi:hypothetical protein